MMSVRLTYLNFRLISLYAEWVALFENFVQCGRELGDAGNEASPIEKLKLGN